MIIYLFELFAGTVASSLFLDQKLVVCVYVFRSRCAIKTFFLKRYFLLLFLLFMLLQLVQFQF